MRRFVFFAIMTLPIPSRLCSACWRIHKVSTTLWIGLSNKMLAVIHNFSLLSGGGIGLFTWPRLGNGKKRRSALLSFQSYWQEMPALALIEGIINAVMLLPDDHREMALKNVPIYQDVTANLVAKADIYHSHAATCFEFAEQSLADIADDDLARFISDWRLWIRLMDPNSTNGKRRP